MHFGATSYVLAGYVLTLFVEAYGRDTRGKLVDSDTLQHNASVRNFTQPCNHADFRANAKVFEQRWLVSDQWCVY